MDAITLDTRAIMTKEPEKIAVAARQARAPTKTSKCEVVCYGCSGPNHLARDCLQGRAVEILDRSRRSMRVFRCDNVGHVVSEIISGNLSPKEVNEILTGRKCTDFVDPG